MVDLDSMDVDTARGGGMLMCYSYMYGVDRAGSVS